MYQNKTPAQLAISALLHVCLGVVYFVAIMGLFAFVFGIYL